GIADRPVVRAVVLALDAEVVGQEAREVREVMQRRAADAPAALIAVADRMLAFEDEGSARGLHPASPDVRADEIARLPIRPLLEYHHLLALAGHDGGEHRAGSAGADDGDVDFLVRGHVTTSSWVRCGPCKESRGPRSPRACR